MARLSRNVKKQLIRAGVLLLIFMAALAAYFVVSFQNVEAEFTVYTSMEEPRLPVLYVSMGGREANTLHGYIQDMGSAASGDCITVLPEDRSLDIHIASYGSNVTGLRYEIRSLDLQHFVERTEIADSDIRSEGEELYVSLPIQNLIARDTQYLLTIQVDTAEETLRYYTKIIWPTEDHVSGMMDFVMYFAERTFDYDAARELATYMETSDTADNTDLGEVGIESSFSQLTWGSTDMRLATEPKLTLKVYDGIMSVIEASYIAERTGSTGNPERYNVTEEYTLRQGSERIYLMDYKRSTDQIFDGSKYLFAGKRIDLGINSYGALQDMRSPNGRYIAFKSNRELWCYDEEGRTAVSVFSFRSGVDDGVRAGYDKHDIKILSMEDTGILDFVVYGYMNRGVHEGYNGIAYYRYNFENDILTELFFMPLENTFERIKLELSELCRKGGNDMLYLKQNDSVVAIDLNSLEIVVVASGLMDGAYAVNDLQTKFAWQDGDIFQSESLRLLDIESGTTRSLHAEPGGYIRVIGFSNDDLIVGYAGAGDVLMINGRTKALPMHSIEIVNGTLGVEKEYSRESVYVDDVRVEGSRIMLTLYRKTEDLQDYEYYGEDTIVSTEAIDTEASSIQNTSDSLKKKVYYVALNNEIRTTRSLEVRAPEQISYENSGRLEIADSRIGRETIIFYAYASGELKLKTRSLSEAIGAVYEDMGYVTDEHGDMIYNRTNRTEAAAIQNPMQAAYQLIIGIDSMTGSKRVEDSRIIILDSFGLTLDQLLYYVYKGIPAAVFREDGSYVLIYGYDNTDIRIYDPQAQDDSGREQRMTREDASQWIFSLGYDSICAVEY